MLGSKRPDLFSVYSTVPASLLQNVVTSAGGGLGDWPVWFFRHNFTQTGFEPPPGAGPIITVEVTNRDAKSGRLEVRLTVNRFALPQTADGCGADETALLRTRFVLDDQVHAPVAFNVEQPWTCKKSKLTTP